MTTTLIEPILAPTRNDNGGIVPPWLQHPPIGLYPMPEPPIEQQQDEDE